MRANHSLRAILAHAPARHLYWPKPMGTPGIAS